MFSFLESLDNSIKGKWFKILLAPIWLLLEGICLYKYWRKLILPELISSDEIFNFINNNEFGLKHNRLVKKDLIDENDYLVGRSLKDCKTIIMREYVEALTKLISTNSNSDIEELITLQVITDTKISVINDDVISNRVYEVYIQFCRYWWYQKAKQYALVWFSIVILLVSIIFAMLLFI